MKTVQIPAGHAGYDTRAVLTERTGQRVRDLIAEAATGASTRGGTAQQVGDYYASVTDQVPPSKPGVLATDWRRT